ncbi:WxcM-like domain-containing protein [bacterium]|nr:MAG: WxcM-like domain-containing protein [bacterium]
MNVRIVQFPKISDPRGNLTFLQNPEQIPFEIKRVFWTYDVPGGEIRGGHAYKHQKEIIIALSGSFDVVITNVSGEQQRFQLNRSYFGLYLPPKTWRHMENFSTNSLGLHLSSEHYSKEDYIYNLEEL